MIHLLRSEWIKFRSVRSTVITLLLGGAIVVLVAVLVATSADTGTAETCQPVDPQTTTASTVPDPICGSGWEVVEETVTTHLTELTGGVTFAALIFGTLGVQAIGQEYRFNTIRPTFTAAPRRPAVMVAKLVVVAVACAVVAAVMVAICWAVGTALLDSFELDAVDRRAAWGIVVFTALWTMAGVGVGAIVRQPVAGILLLAAESLIIEGLIGSIFPASQRWLPFSNGVQMTLRTEDAAIELRPMLEGGIYFGLVCLAMFVIGTWLVQRRDA